MFGSHEKRSGNVASGKIMLDDSTDVGNWCCEAAQALQFIHIDSPTQHTQELEDDPSPSLDPRV